MQGRLDPTSPLPRYYQIYSALLAMIQSGELVVGEALPPERQIAELFGVARPTVVKALDLLEREGLIEKQRGRGSFVLEPPTEANASSKTVAFISSPSLTYDLMMGISQTAFEHSYQLQIFAVDADVQHLGMYLETCVNNGVKGFLVYGRPGTRDVHTYEQFLNQAIPVVMVDRYYPGLACDHVVYDNEGAGFDLTRKLLARGHRRIAIVPGFELNATSVQDRLSGYRRALKTQGLDYDEDLVWLDLYDKRSPSGVVNESYQIHLRERLMSCRPTALVTINELIADHVIHDLLVLQNALMRSDRPSNIDVTDIDVELATFDDRLRPDSSYLSVVAVHPTVDLGRAAAKLLIGRLEGQVTGAPHHQVIPMDIAEVNKVRQFA